ncbi:MAG: hypothetical protein FWG48_04575 [Oscillospiraceae bacterium]|nr:hypothetical protein [Oscillospiraceae bacterium]
MEQTRTYTQTKEYIVNTIFDIIELQKGSLILSDALRGIVYYKVSMYGYEWELMYTVTQMRGKEGQRAPPKPGTGARTGTYAKGAHRAAKEQSSVTLRIIGERRENEKEMRRELALLESMLNI